MITIVKENIVLIESTLETSLHIPVFCSAVSYLKINYLGNETVLVRIHLERCIKHK